MNVQESLDSTSKEMSLLLERLELLEKLSNSPGPVAPSSKKVAKETLQRYTTRAEDLGLKQLKDRLEDLCFQLLHPVERNRIIEKVRCIFGLPGRDTLRLILDNLTKTLLSNGLGHFEILGRQKTPFSIYQKLKRKSLEVEQLRDVLGFRVIVSSIPECYMTMSILHDIFPMEISGFKDYIMFPKDEGYQSLHTTIIGPYQKRIEVQVRTVDMDTYTKATLYKEYWKQKTSFV